MRCLIATLIQLQYFSNANASISLSLFQAPRNVFLLFFTYLELHSYIFSIRGQGGGGGSVGMLENAIHFHLVKNGFVILLKLLSTDSNSKRICL